MSSCIPRPLRRRRETCGETGPRRRPSPGASRESDPGLDALIAADAKVELVASGFGLNEGTTWVRDGHGSGFLLLGGLLDNVLYKIAPDNTVSVFMEKAGYSGDDVDNVGAQTRAGRSHVLLIGPSCSGVDPQAAFSGAPMTIAG